MLERVAAASDDARFYAFDLPVAETARRHAMHPKAARFTAQEMALWYHNWQPLAFVDEHRITAAESPEEIVARILGGRVTRPSRSTHDRRVSRKQLPARRVKPSPRIDNTGSFCPLIDAGVRRHGWIKAGRSRVVWRPVRRRSPPRLPRNRSSQAACDLHRVSTVSQHSPRAPQTVVIALCPRLPIAQFEAHDINPGRRL